MWIWYGFHRLSNTRPQGFNGHLRIPVSEVKAYCDLMGWEREKRIDFLYYIELMDGVWMAHVAKQRESEEIKNRAKAPTTTPRRR